MYLGDFVGTETINHLFTTVQATGAPTTLAGTPKLRCYKNGSTTESSDLTPTVDFDSRTGLNLVAIDLTGDSSFYATGQDYNIVITAGTVNSVSVVGYVVGAFSILHRSPLRPTTAGRTLDVSAGGEAGLDWANVGSPTTAVDLSGTTIKTTQKVDVDTIKTNPVVNGGTITFPTTATLASTTNITAGTVTTATNVTTVNGLAANVITATSINADAITAAKIADGAIDAATFAAGAIDATAIAANAIGTSEFSTGLINSIADQVWDEAIAGHAGAGSTGAALSAAGSAGDPWSTALPGAYGAGTAGKIVGDNVNATISSRASQTSVDTIDDFVDTEVAAIKAKTDNLPAAPAATGDAMTLTSGERNSVADALLNRDLSTGSDSGSSTVRTVRQALRFLRNKWSVAGGTLTVTKEDDSTSSWTATVTTTAGDPVSTVDPAGP